MIPPLWQKVKRHVMNVKEDSEKAGLKLNIQKTKIMASSPITSCQIDGETMEIVTDFIFLDCSHEIKRCLLLGRKAMTNLDSILKSRDITLPTRVRLDYHCYPQHHHHGHHYSHHHGYQRLPCTRHFSEHHLSRLKTYPGGQYYYSHLIEEKTEVWSC